MAEAITACCNIDYSTNHEDHLSFRPPEHCDNFLSKHPGDIINIWPSIAIDKNLYVICMIRDPRDSIVSQHRNSDSLYYCTLRYWKCFYPYVKKYRGNKRFISIKYEDFVENPDDIQRKLVEEIPFLRAIHPFSRYHLVAQPSTESNNALSGVRPIGPTGIGGWKDDLGRIKQQIRLHGDISEDLLDLGYEKDSNWLKLLDGVAEVNNKSHWPEFFTKKDLNRRRKIKYKEALKRVLTLFKLLSEG